MTDEQVFPEDDDAFICDVRDGYSISCERKYIATHDSMDAAVGALVDCFTRDNYWPNVWYVNDHGNQTLLLITVDEHPSMADFTWEFSDVAYV